jgi:hypothetical protein
MSLAGKPGQILCGESERREVYRFLGKIKITDQTDQSCQDPSQIHAIKGVEQFGATEPLPWLTQNRPSHSLSRDRQAEIGFCQGSPLAEISSSSTFMISLPSV